uniref:Protein YIPF n=1 Tax=Romanomermis culicivorax TaxID=13658 RepID=A0A915HQ20_ROMCU
MGTHAHKRNAFFSGTRISEQLNYWIQMKNTWQTDNQQWYSGGSQWSPGDASSTGYDIPIDDFCPDQQPTINDFLGPGVKATPTAKNQSKSPVPPFYSSTTSGSGKSLGVGLPAGVPFWDSQPHTRDSSDGVEDDDKPLLEELGINFDHIRQKTFAVLNPLLTADMSVLNDNDLAGPLVFCLLFGFSLLLHGKLHFGYIYGIGLLGCASMYVLLNLMSNNGISLTCAVSVLGYCLLPMSILSLIAAVFSFKGTTGLIIALAAVLWCSLSSSKLFVTALLMDKQRILVAYPCSLFYGVFALLAIY